MTQRRIPISEVFSKPLLKNIIFQIQYPNLFYIENRVGDFQLKILEKFPQSALLYRRQIVFADVGSNVKQESLSNSIDKNFSKKIWQFKSNLAEIDISSDSLGITSNVIKTYRQGENNFRGIVSFVLNKFLEVMAIPEFKRMGLRYVNEAQIRDKNNTNFNSMFASTFPTSRFKVENANSMLFRAVDQQNKMQFIFQESLQVKNNKTTLILDLDSASENVSSRSYLGLMDQLHDKIKKEFVKSIKKPIIEAMRGGAN